MSQIGLTESVKGDARRFEIWLQGRAEVHTIQAPSIDVKQSWVRQIKGVLMSQLAELKGKQNSALGKSNHKYVIAINELTTRAFQSFRYISSLLLLLKDRCDKQSRGKLKAVYRDLCEHYLSTATASSRT